MADYRVVWEIELSANTPEGAARKALAMQRDPNSTAVVFNVTDVEGTDLLVDLMEEKPCA